MWISDRIWIRTFGTWGENEKNADEPPCSLHFYGEEEVECFFLSSTWPDEEFQDYIEEKNLIINGIRDKNDVVALKEKLMGVPFPDITNGTMTTLIIYPEEDRLIVRYETSGDERCSFRIDYSTLTETKTIAEAEQEVQHKNGSSFVKQWHDEENVEHVYKGTIDGCSIVYRYFGSEKNAEQTIEKKQHFLWLYMNEKWQEFDR